MKLFDLNHTLLLGALLLLSLSHVRSDISDDQVSDELAITQADLYDFEPHSTELVNNLEPVQDEISSGVDYGSKANNETASSNSSVVLDPIVLDSDVSNEFGDSKAELTEEEKPQSVEVKLVESDLEVNTGSDEIVFNVTEKGEAAVSDEVSSVQTFTVDADKEDEMQASTQMPFDDDEFGSGDSSETFTIGDDVKLMCPDTEFSCDNKCVDLSKKCNSIADCDDGSDELDCPETTPAEIEELSISIAPAEQTDNGLVLKAREGDSVSFSCTVSGPYPQLKTIIYRDQQLITESETETATAVFDNIRGSDEGEYLCYGFPPDRSTYAAAAVKVFVNRTSSPSDFGRVRLIEANLNTHVELSCDLASNNNNNQVRWRKLSGVKSAYSQENMGKLYLYYLKLEDGGEYECYTADGRSSNRVNLVVKDPNSRPTVHPEYSIRTVLEKSNIDFKTGEDHNQMCTGMTNGYDLRIEWFNKYGQAIQNSRNFAVVTEVVNTSPMTKRSRLNFIGLRPEMAGRYECRVIVNDQQDSISFDLNNIDAAPVNPGNQETRVCDIIEATCRNGECVSKAVLCNGVMDCSDGSDEQNCGGGSVEGRCEPNEMQCHNGKCVQKIWYCDGENDCGDNSDELNCPVSKPEDICKSHEFLCASGDQCVLKGFVCDSENDCRDQSDEIGCRQPTILRGPTRNLTVVIGGTIEISCEATGFPEPYINWRLNWGHVCEPPRCFSKTERGRGTLTITDAVREDAGAYSCEALNSKGRLFAIPDAILTVYETDRPRPCNCFNHADRCDANGNCINCQHNTMGKRCEMCMSGFTGNPRIGSPDDCKPFVPQCGRAQFYGTRNQERACVPCFCNGLKVNCESSSLTYRKINSLFHEDDENWKIVDSKSDALEAVNIDRQSAAITFTAFEDERDYFFEAPAKFKGNKLASYGGNVSFSIRYEGSNVGERPKNLELILSGANGLKLVYKDRAMLPAYEDHSFVIELTEDNFKRLADNGPVDRASFLMALSSIKDLRIRASFISRKQYLVTLSQVTMDHGQDIFSSPMLDRMARVKATAVEICQCPEGYSGISCESCAPGYKKATTGFYLGQCIKQNEQILVIDVPNNNLVLTPGQTHVIHVTINGGGQVVWQKESEPYGYLPKGVRQDGNNLVITDARPEISGNYACTVFTPTGEVKEVIVITVAPTVRSPPGIYSPNRRITNVRVGDRFRLECKAQGVPLPSIHIETPRRAGAAVAAEMRDISAARTPTAVVDIEYFTEANVGEYRCIAENEYGERAVETFIVNQDSGSFLPPTIRVEPKDLVVIEGSNILINTSITGTQPVFASVRLYGPQQLSNLYVNDLDNSVEIKGVTKENEGQYIITVTNQFGSANDYFHLKVNAAPGPKIFTVQKTLRVQEGSSLRLEPKVQFTGKPFFTWTGPINSNSLVSNAQQSEQSLFIPSLLPMNDGTYTLTLIDSTGTTSVGVRVIVESSGPAQVTRRPNSMTPFNIFESQVIELEAGEQAMLVCALKPDVQRPNALVFQSWSKASGRFERNMRPNIERLQILKFKESNQGDYKCQVVTSEGFRREVIVTLKLKDESNAVVTDKDENESTFKPFEPQTAPTTGPQVRLSAKLRESRKNINAGENFEIACDVTGNPRPRIVWMLNQEIIHEGQHQLYPRNEILYGRQVSSALNGYIFCRAIDGAGRYEEDSVLINVIEEATTPAPQAPLDVRVEPTQLQPFVGETAQVQCYVENSRSPYILDWQRQDGMPLPGDSQLTSDRSLITLRNLQASDSGVYVCRVIDRATGLEYKAYTTLIVLENSLAPQEPLKVSVQPEVAPLVQGQDAEFICSVNGNADNMILVWKKMNGDLDVNRHVVVNNGRILKVFNVQQEDRGYFECQADNGKETDRGYVRVDVEAREKPSVEIYPQQSEIFIDRGAVAYAQCRVVAGIPGPKVEWKRADGSALSSNIVISQEGSLLQIQDANEAEFGVYICSASNIAGTAEQRIAIKPREQDRPHEDDSQSEEERRREFERKRQEEENRRRQEEERQRQEEERRRQEEERQRQEQEDNRQNNKPDAITERQVQAQEGQSVTLECRTTSRLETKTYWLSPENQYVKNVNPDGSVIFPTVRRSDSGVWTCIVVNNFGNSRSQVELKVNYFDKSNPLKVELTPKSRRVLQGTNLDFNCRVQNSPNPDKVQWSRQDGQPLPEGHIANGHILRLVNAQPEDGGRYQCGSSNDGAYSYDDAYLEVVGEDKKENNFPVFIQVKTEGLEPNPNAAIGNMYHFGILMKVDCVPQTTDDARIESIKWSKQEGGADRHKQERHGDKNTLVLEALSSMDLGTYVCIARKENGEIAQNEILFENHADHGAFFHYKIKGPSETVVYEEESVDLVDLTTKRQTTRPVVGQNTAPTVRILEEDRLSLKVSQTLELNCETTGFPVPHLKWTNNAGEVLSDQPILRVPDLTMENSGYYVCTAENTEGSARAYVYLDVVPQVDLDPKTTRAPAVESTTEPIKGKKPFVYMKSLNGDLNILGKDFTIVCLVSDPEAHVEFIYDKSQANVQVSEHPEDPKMKLLTIHSFSDANAGDYICSATNQFGEHQETASIKKEYDDSYHFATNNLRTESLAIKSMGTLTEGNYIELSAEPANKAQSRRMRRQLSEKFDYFTWTRDPSLPKSSISEGNRLIVQQFDETSDNGLYFVRATAGDVDYYGSKLIASNDFLLSDNNFFSVEKEDENTILIRCRPFLITSIYTWKNKHSDVQQNEHFRIEGDELYIYKSDVTSHFTCQLRMDGELGPINLDIEVNQELQERALNKQIVRVQFNYDGNDDYYNYDDYNNYNADDSVSSVDCIPGKTCVDDYDSRVRTN